MIITKVNHLSNLQITQIVKIHQSELKDSTLNIFGKQFLKEVYPTIAEDKNNIFLILTEGQNIIGFLVASIDIEKFYKNIITSKPLTLSWQIAKSSILNPLLFFKVLIWVLKPKPNDSHPSELQFIAVDREHQGKGLGTKLIKHLNTDFAERGVDYYKVGTIKKDPDSNRFYQKLNFKFLYHKKIFLSDFNYYLSTKTS